MAQTTKSSKARSPKKRKPPSKPTAPRANGTRSSDALPADKLPQDVPALFTRAEGCTVRQYALAMGVSRQAASKRLQRFVELGILVMASANHPLSLADLAKHNARHAPASNVYRAARKSAS